MIHALFVLLGTGLAVGVLLLITLRVLLGFLLILGRVHIAPTAAAVGFLPAGACVLVNISIVAGVHVTVR